MNWVFLLFKGVTPWKPSKGEKEIYSAYFGSYLLEGVLWAAVTPRNQSAHKVWGSDGPVDWRPEKIGCLSSGPLRYRGLCSYYRTHGWHNWKQVGEISDALVRKWRCFGWRESWEVGPGATSKAVARDTEIPWAWRSAVGAAIQDQGEPECREPPPPQLRLWPWRGESLQRAKNKTKASTARWPKPLIPGEAEAGEYL